jgi:hypothetical protein
MNTITNYIIMKEDFALANQTYRAETIISMLNNTVVRQKLFPENA